VGGQSCFYLQSGSPAANVFLGEPGQRTIEVQQKRKNKLLCLRGYYAYGQYMETEFFNLYKR